MTATIYILFFLIPTLLIASFIAVRRRNSKAAEEKWKEDEKEEILPQDTPDDAFVFVRYRGEIITMRVWEKREHWDSYGREQKNEHLAAIKKAVKKGHVVKEYIDEAKVLCCYLPASGNLKKVREDYKQFSELGGKIIE